MLPVTETQEINKELVKLPIKNRAIMRRTIKNIGHYIELIDWKNNLQKMECELKRIVNPRPQNTAQKTAIKKLTDIPPINICCIGAIGFY